MLDKLAAVLLVWLTFANAPVLCSLARADDVHANILPSLVYLKASGDVRSGQNMGQRVDSYGTGFIISSDGLVLTTAHLINSLGDIALNTVSLEAHVGSKTAPDIGAQIVDWTNNLDLMILKLPPHPTMPYSEVTLGRAHGYDPAQPIYSSGFSQAITVARSRGSTIQSKDGPGGYLWATGFTFEPGESGSPVYDAAGRVLGVVKGDQGSLAFMIPIEYGDSLLAQIRLRDIQQSLQEFDGMRQSFTWSGSVTRVPNGRLVALRYEKLVAGEPQVVSVTLRIKPLGQISGRPDSLKPFQVDNLPRTAAIGSTGGVFELPDLWESIEDVNKVYRMDPIEHLQIQIVATLSNGSQLSKVTILVSCEEKLTW